MPALDQALVDNGHRFSYFQAIRLLRRANAQRAAGGTQPGAASPQAALRIRPNLSLGFPQADIERIEARPGGGHRITANFLGLYGVSSPLPTFYSEDLLEDEREGRSARREFLDILHGAIYPQFFEAWRKYRLQLRAVEEQDPRALDALYAFAGLGSQAQRGALPMADSLLRYLGLFAHRTRSAMGLRSLLADAFAPARVEILCGDPQWLPIPAGQRLRLGLQAHALGEDSHLGPRIEDSDNRLRIVLAGLPHALFQQLLPGRAGHAWLQLLTRYYLSRPLQVAVELRLADGECRGARLGERADEKADEKTDRQADGQAADPAGASRAAPAQAQAQAPAAAGPPAAGPPAWCGLGLDTWLGAVPPGGAASAGFHLPSGLFSVASRNCHAAG